MSNEVVSRSWFYADAGNKTIGPIDERTLLAKLALGQITPDTPVASLKRTGNTWRPVKDLPELLDVYVRGESLRILADAAQVEKQNVAPPPIARVASMPTVSAPAMLTSAHDSPMPTVSNYQPPSARRSSPRTLSQKMNRVALLALLLVRTNRVAVLALLLVSGCCVFSMIGGSLFSPNDDKSTDDVRSVSSSTKAPTQSRARAGTGDIAVLNSQGPDSFFAAANEEAHSRLIRLCVAKDEMGIQQMMLVGLVRLIQNGTKARVLEPGLLSCEVRLLDGPFAGESCIVAAEFVSRSDPAPLANAASLLPSPSGQRQQTTQPAKRRKVSPVLPYRVVHVITQRDDGAPTYYVLLDNELELASPSFKDDVRNVIRDICNKHSDKVSIELHDNVASLDVSYRQYGVMPVGTTPTPEGRSLMERHYIALFTGHLPLGSTPHDLDFFPAAFTSSTSVGKYVGFEEFDPVR